ncbi:MAG: efflux RND transporter periplasmic adaptor subunit [Caulobacteraceae bacterium]|nr:efflux RND transporter periplasmic adaptor subunit [Caulobacteraceae bacterium]
MLKRHFFLVGAICVLLLMVVAGGFKLLTGRSGDPASAQGAPAGKGAGPGGHGGGVQVKPVLVATRTFRDAIEAIGVAKGRQSVTITAPTAELVTHVRFSDGQFVPKGAVLVELQASEQSADVAAQQANLVEAQNAWQRTKTLADKGFASKAALDQAQATLNAARAQVAAARARQGDRTIRAPFAGVVGLSDIAPGALINPGQPIVTLDDVSMVRVDFDLPDRYLPQVSEGQAITARPDAYPGEVFQGRIARLDTRINPQTRAVTARAEFPNPGGRIKPGMLLRVGVTLAERQGAALPEAAVSVQGPETFVFVIKSEGGHTIAERRPVKIGARESEFVEIAEGVRVGERVVADGLNRIQPNQTVQVAGAPASPPGKGGGRPRPAA